MLRLTKTGIATAFLTLTLLLSGCVLGGEQAINEIDPPKDVTILEEGESLDQPVMEQSMEDVQTEEQGNTEMVLRELYLLDKNGFVVPQSVALPKTKEVAKQALEYLVKNGPITNMVPNGFEAVLPIDTQVLGLNLLEDGTIVADFSKEFMNYSAEEELKILQSITWTLTQFENVERVQIRINGYDQEVMPVNSTPIGKGMSRADGINLETGSVVDLNNSKAVTLYFLAQNGDNVYYVPITRRIFNDGESSVVAAVKELISGPSYQSGLLTDFHDSIKLLDIPDYSDGIVTLNFNEALLGNLQGTAVSKHLIESLVLSLTEQQGIEGVAIQVNGNEQVVSEEGDVLTEPVSRPERVNTGSF
jgi:germination protein M